jgi:hypothetical protein
MNLHPEIQTLFNTLSKKETISIEDKQLLVNRAIKLKQDLTFIVKELEKIEKNILKRNNNLNKCEACGEILPALDRVCPSCKSVKNSKGKIDLTLDDLIFEIEAIISELKSSNSLSLSKRLLKNSSLSFPFFIGSSFVLGWNFNSDVLALVFLCSLCLWLLVLRRLKSNLIKTEVALSTKPFQVLHSQIENKLRLLGLYFGNDGRTNEHLLQLKQEIQKVQNQKKKLFFYELLIYCLAFILLIIVGYFTVI